MHHIVNNYNTSKYQTSCRFTDNMNNVSSRFHARYDMGRSILIFECVSNTPGATLIDLGSIYNLYTLVLAICMLPYCAEYPRLGNTTYLTRYLNLITTKAQPDIHITPWARYLTKTEQTDVLTLPPSKQLRPLQKYMHEAPAF